MRIAILGLDGLEYKYVKEFGFKNLLQESFGKTDISDFEQPRTAAIWPSFLSGKNLDKEIPIKGQWEFKLKPEQTFFSKFKSYKAIDVPGFNFSPEQHKKERQLLKAFFENKISIEEYDASALAYHQKVKNEFFSALGKYEIVMGYFNIADIIGHLSFGVKSKMKMIYEELDKIADRVRSKYPSALILIISDHGMKAIGRFGDHSNYGFWSLNKRADLKNPKITEFYDLIVSEDVCS